MPRAQTGDLQSPQRLQVVARPTDPFVLPAKVDTTRSDKLQSLARALSDVQPSLRNYLNDTIDRKTEEELKAGQQARLKNAMGFREAVENGLIDKTQSPWFMKGYNIQSGKADTYNYDLALREAYAASTIRSERDPETVEGFFENFRSTWLQANGNENPDYLDGLLPIMSQAEGNVRSSHNAFIAESIKEENLDNLTTDHIETIDRAYRNGMSFDQIASNISNINENQLFAAGFTRSEINDITLNNIITLAVEKRDPNILKLANHVKAGQHPLSDRPISRQKLEDARAQIASRTAAEYRLNNAIKEDLRNQQKAQISTEALNTLIEDPSADMTPYFRRAAATGSPELVNTLNALQGAVENNSQQPNMNAIKGLIVDIRNGVKDEQDVLDAFVNGDLNADWEKRLREMVTQTKDDSSPINDTEFRYYNNQLQRVLVGDDFSIDRQQDQVEAMDKVFQFQQEYMDFQNFTKDGKERERPPTQREKTEFLQERSRYWQWKGASDRTRHRLFLSGQLPPEGIDFNLNLPSLGDDLFRLHPDLYDPNKNVVFESLQTLGDSIVEYNQALQRSPDAARNTYFGRLIVDTGMMPEQLKQAQERLLNTKRGNE
jgi:sugar-specific transcriptional regulator TrmB